MIRLRALLVILLTACAPAAALSAAEPLAADPQWSRLFDALTPTTGRFARFEERRFFPFRKQPVVLAGELRYSPVHGVSLSYLEPERRTLIGSPRGLWLRDGRGRTRTLPNDSRVRAATELLFDVLRFDLAALRRNFELSGERDGDRWTLHLTPRDPGVSQALGEVRLTGHDTTLDQITIARPDRQRIDIELRERREDVTFTTEEVARYFR